MRLASTIFTITLLSLGGIATATAADDWVSGTQGGKNVWAHEDVGCGLDIWAGRSIATNGTIWAGRSIWSPKIGGERVEGNTLYSSGWVEAGISVYAHYDLHAKRYVSAEQGISTNGTVTAQNVKAAYVGTAKLQVRSDYWADHVFADDYQLMPLPEVADYIAEHRHLPKVPSARELKEHGVDVHAMFATHMEKIEELTLHAIALEQRLAEQEQIIDALLAERGGDREGGAK